FFNNNNAWLPFTPRLSDRLLASVDFDADVIASLEGLSGQIDGIEQGFTSSDLTFSADLFAGNVNDGEFTVSGTFFEAPARDVFSLGAVNLGVAVQDDTTGQGYMLYSVEDVQSRFADAPPIAANSSNLVAVQVINDMWFYNNNSQWIEFTPVHSDVLIAGLDFDSDTITDFEGSFGEVGGIATGYTDGDLTFAADTWNGRINDGEFTASGTFFDIERRVQFTQDVRGGVAVQDDAAGEGYILYSGQDVQDRFSSNGFNNQHGDKLLAVQFQNGQWFFNNNRTWFPFTPRPTDRLIAAVDFDADTIVGLRGNEGEINGIRQGYSDGDLTFLANIYEGIDNPGEFTVGGSWFRENISMGDTSTSGVVSSTSLASARLADSKDTSGDDRVSPLDALLVINRLAAAEGEQESGDGRLDVNGDGLLSPVDALQVINFLSSQVGEGEQLHDTAILQLSDEEDAFVTEDFDFGLF
ncbi:MAG: dockerin type I domain-containing protein, partial [Planctomycetota bacterium]